jgi:tRNA modification GTPase
MTMAAHHDLDTIVAISTPVGRGGIGIVRLSGSEALIVAAPLLRLRHPLAAGRARFGELVDRSPESEPGAVLDEVVATYFARPHSYTGEDVVEIAAHGSPVLLEAVVRACCAGGARLAEPGEFTQRAFLAGRLDLTQAEAVDDLIAASTLGQARLAARQMGGSLARAVRPAKEELIGLIAAMEAGIDFTEDDIDIIPAAAVMERIAAVRGPIESLERSFAAGRVVREGFRMAIVGRPNAGKSSLFNRLVERERAIVTATPGTTRDTVAERVAIQGIPVELIDTAGLREATDEAERMGIARSREALAEAEVVLLVVDASAGVGDEDRSVLAASAGRGVIVAWNKCDLSAGAEDAGAGLPGVPMVQTSALTGEGIASLRGAILVAMHVQGSVGEAGMLTNVRQHSSVQEALRGLDAARDAVATSVPHEMVLIDLYGALRGLDSLTGLTTSEDVLRLIFSRFCIGK